MTNLATKNGWLIVKDGKVAEDCNCCGGWYCDNVCQEVFKHNLTVSVAIENATPVGITPLAKTDAGKPFLDDLGGVSFPVPLIAPTSPDLSLDHWPSGVVRTNAGSSSDTFVYEKGDEYKLSLHCERSCYILYGYSQTVTASLIAGVTGGPLDSLAMLVPGFECTMKISLDASLAIFSGYYAGRLNVAGYTGNAGLFFVTTVPFSPAGFSTRINSVLCAELFETSRSWLCDIVITTTAT